MIDTGEFYSFHFQIFWVHVLPNITVCAVNPTLYPISIINLVTFQNMYTQNYFFHDNLSFCKVTILLKIMKKKLNKEDQNIVPVDRFKKSILGHCSA